MKCSGELQVHVSSNVNISDPSYRDLIPRSKQELERSDAASTMPGPGAPLADNYTTFTK